MIRRLSIFLLSAFICAGCMPALAQTKEFKDKWTKLMKPIYYHAEGVIDKKPDGATEFAIFAFNGKNEYQAPVEFSGDIQSFEKNKGYSIELSNGAFKVKNDDYDITYTGYTALTILRGKADDINIKIYLNGGKLNFNGEEFAISNVWGYTMGWIEVSLPEDYKFDSPIIVDVDKFRVPQKRNVPTKTTADIIKKIQNGSINFNEADAAFINQIVRKGDVINDLPEFSKNVFDVYDVSNDSLVATELVDYQLGNVIDMRYLKARRDGSNINIEIEDFDGWKKGNAVFSTSPAYMEFTKIAWDNGCRFDERILTRSDNSRLSGVSFKGNPATHSDAGYVTNQLQVLQELCDPELYDFADLHDDSGLEVLTYFAPGSDKGEFLDDNVINTIAERKAEEMREMKRREAEAQRKRDEAVAAFHTQQLALGKEWDKYHTDPIPFATVENNMVLKPYQVKVTKYISYNPVSRIYDVNFKVNDNGTEYPLQVDRDGDYYYNIYNRMYPLKFDGKSKTELDLWSILKQMMNDPKFIEAIAGPQ